MSYYYDAKLYYKKYYHRRLYFSEAYGNIHYDPDKKEYYYNMRRRTWHNMVAIKNDTIHRWHRKRKSRYAVCPVFGWGGVVCHLDDNAMTTFDHSDMYYVGVLNGITYWEVSRSVKFEKDNARFLAKSEDGLFYETICEIPANSETEDRHFKAFSPHNCLILQEKETYVKENGRYKSSNFKYLKYDPKTETINEINLSSKITDVVMRFYYPFVMVSTHDTVTIIDTFGDTRTICCDSNINRTDCIFFINENDNVVNITESVQPDQTTLGRLSYTTNGSYYVPDSDFVINDYAFSIEEVYDYLLYLTKFNSSDVISSGLCDGEDFLLGFNYTNWLPYDNGNIDLAYITILDGEYAGKASDPFSVLESEEIKKVYFRVNGITGSLSKSSFHFFKINKDGTNITRIPFFEKKEIVGESYKYEYEYYSRDVNKFYFINFGNGCFTLLKFNNSFDEVVINHVNYDSNNKPKYLVYPYGKNNNDLPLQKGNFFTYSDGGTYVKTYPLFKDGKFFNVVWWIVYSTTYMSWFIADDLNVVNTEDGPRMYGGFNSEQSMVRPSLEELMAYCFYASQAVYPSQTFESLEEIYYNIE